MINITNIENNALRNSPRNRRRSYSVNINNGGGKSPKKNSSPHLKRAETVGRYEFHPDFKRIKRAETSGRSVFDQDIKMMMHYDPPIRKMIEKNPGVMQES